MTMLMLILAGWVVLSLPLALLVARMFRTTPPADRPRQGRLSRARIIQLRNRMPRSARPVWVGQTSPTHLGQDGARAATGSRSAH
ncbi:hypothetical protein [Nocardia sp. NPDC051832]|uniref:hypothetical protein n=1 Tax=Nocardia sp. NPDC051832 TaxID=3155673 RepID=UPI00344349BD